MTGILGTRIMAALAALFNFLALNLALLVFNKLFNIYKLKIQHPLITKTCLQSHLNVQTNG